MLPRKIKKILGWKKLFKSDQTKGLNSSDLNSPEVPSWFRSQPGDTLQTELGREGDIFLYVPWIREHGDSVIRRLSETGGLRFAAFDLVGNTESNSVRRAAARFARDNPGLFRRMVLKRLIPLQSRVRAIVLTFDWAPFMRIIASACNELSIPTILIPHESVFVDSEKYYWDSTANASVPVCDFVLGWGELQRSIFVSRGYDADRFITVGAPKFDAYHNYKSVLTRDLYHHIFGLDPSKKTILFATQPLDSQLDANSARTAQREAISDLLDYCASSNCQLLVRLPPSRDDILGSELRGRIASTELASFDDANCYMVGPEEAIHHADLVVSINSTMLFESVLSKTPSISIKYIDFPAFWEKAGIPVVRSVTELSTALNSFLGGEWRADKKGMEWAGRAFGIGSFDGAASERICAFLNTIPPRVGGGKFSKRPTAVERLFSKSALDVVAIPSTPVVQESSQRYFKDLVNARWLQSSREEPLAKLASADIFFQWGITPTPAKQAQRLVATELGKPTVIVEDGFLRSVGIGLSGEPGLSIILDDTTAYYDATKPSRLERLLQSGPELTEDQQYRARRAIDLIVASRVSKYNSAPDLKMDIGNAGRRKVLIVDQRYGDQSVESGLANENSFSRMLEQALERHSDCDIIVKQHPDAIIGGKSSYFSVERMDAYRSYKNIFSIRADVNPYALFDIVEDVYVVTSGMGFEALMAGKNVHCFGAPFYAGWGLTNDDFPLSARRTRHRSIEDVFHYAYIEASRYFDPDKQELVEVEGIVKYLLEKKASRLAQTA